jgi:molecular chaperone GrpE (heat shock protein)
MDRDDTVEAKLAVLRRDKARLVRERVRLQSKLDDARTEVSALKRELAKIRRRRDGEIQDAIKAHMESFLQEIGDA